MLTIKPNETRTLSVVLRDAADNVVPTPDGVAWQLAQDVASLKIEPTNTTALLTDLGPAGKAEVTATVAGLTAVLNVQAVAGDPVAAEIVVAPAPETPTA